MSRRKSSTPRRRTTSGAITRAFAVRSSASHDPPTSSASTSFETIACRYDAASGPRTLTKSRERSCDSHRRKLHRTSVAAVFRGRAERKVIDAGYDPARLPPGQYLTEKWPVLHAGSIPRTDLATWDFFVSGEVENPIRISWDELNALPRTTHTQDIHCVTRWSRFDVTFEGIHWSALEPLVKPLPIGALRRRARRGGLHRERADLVPSRPAVAPRDPRRRRAARRPSTAARSAS